MLALLIRPVPYDRAHANPPVQAEPAWDSPAAEARRRVNFSNWDRERLQHVDVLQSVSFEHSMPPSSYLLWHPEARLSEAERKQLFDGLAVLTASHWH